MSDETEVFVNHDEERGGFFADLDGREASLTYRPHGENVLDFRSTFVPPRDRGHGIGERLVLAGLEYARENSLKVVPTCPFVSRVVKRHPEYQSLIE